MKLLVIKSNHYRLEPWRSIEWKQYFIWLQYYFTGTINDDEKLMEFAKLRSYIEYDFFGVEQIFYQPTKSPILPNDTERIRRVQLLLKEDYLNRVILAHDVHTKHRLVWYSFISKLNFYLNLCTWKFLITLWAPLRHFCNFGAFLWPPMTHLCYATFMGNNVLNEQNFEFFKSDQ